MSDARQATRTVFVLSRGARLFLLLGVLMLMFAAYLLFAPIDIQSPQGPMFNCGSAARPPTDTFQKNVCGRIDQDRQFQSAFVAGGAIITALGGLVVFGSSRRTERADSPAGRAEFGEEPPYHRPPAGGHSAERR
jgi:hypothetical protein